MQLSGVMTSPGLPEPPMGIREGLSHRSRTPGTEQTLWESNIPPIPASILFFLETQQRPLRTVKSHLKTNCHFSQFPMPGESQRQGPTQQSPIPFKLLYGESIQNLINLVDPLVEKTEANIGKQRVKRSMIGGEVKGNMSQVRNDPQKSTAPPSFRMQFCARGFMATVFHRG